MLAPHPTQSDSTETRAPRWFDSIWAQVAVIGASLAVGWIASEWVSGGNERSVSSSRSEVAQER